MTANLVFPHLDLAAGRALLSERSDWSLERLHDAAALGHPEAAPPPTGGYPVTETGLARLQKLVRDVAADAGYPTPMAKSAEQRFDRPAGTVLYREMGIVPADAAEVGVWTFLCLVLLPEIGPWRFPGMSEDRLLGTPRNVLRRLWWRAWALGEDLDWAPDGCRPLGEDEFVQIMERPSLGGNRRTARAIRDALWRAEALGMSAPRSEVMRELTRRIRAQRSHIALDVLSDDQLSGLLDELTEAAVSQVTRRLAQQRVAS